ncbi:type VI secretion protein, partial [Pseudomonas sp. FW305-3-2-15-C-LB1]
GALARQIRQFVKDMPAVETRRYVLKRELSELADNRRRDAEQSYDADQRGDPRGDERSK